MTKRSVYTLCATVLQLVKDKKVWGKKFLRPEDLEKVRMGRHLSLVANPGLGLAS
jgi:hypothetical protein